MAARVDFVDDTTGGVSPPPNSVWDAAEANDFGTEINSAQAAAATAAGTSTWTGISGKPSTFAPTIGGAGTQAVAGNDSRLTDARPPVDGSVTTASFAGSALRTAAEGLAAEDTSVPTSGAVKAAVDALSGATGGVVNAVVAGGNIDVDNTDPANPVVSLESLTPADVGATTFGASLLAAVDAAAARVVMGAGTSNLALGTTAGTAAAGNDSRLSDARTPTAHTHDWAADITGKPSTFAPTIGSTSTTAVAGNDSRLTDTRTPTDATVTTAKFAAAALRTISEGLAAEDTSVPTSGAVKAAVDAVSGANTKFDLYEDWTNNSNGAPTVLESGQSLTSGYIGAAGAALTVDSGRLTSTYVIGTTSVAGYLSARPKAVTDRVLYAEGGFQFRNFAANANNIVLASLFTATLIPAGAVVGNTQMPVHALFTPTYFGVQTYDAGAADVGLTTYAIASATPKTFELALDSAKNRVVMRGPDGIVRIYEDTVNNRMSSFFAPYAVQEILRTTPNADKYGDWLYWHASTLVGKEEQEFASKWARLLAIADAQQPVFLQSFQNAWAVGQIGSPGVIGKTRHFRKIRYIPMAVGTGTFTVELRDINTGTPFANTSATSTASAKYVEITNGVEGFNFIAGDMPYTRCTAVTATAGVGVDAWLIP